MYLRSRYGLKYLLHHISRKDSADANTNLESQPIVFPFLLLEGLQLCLGESQHGNTTSGDTPGSFRVSAKKMG